MGIRIFRTQRNLRESWLEVNDDGTLTYSLRNFGSRLMREGPEARSRTMCATEARSRWPSYSKSIDLAVAEVTSTLLDQHSSFRGQWGDEPRRSGECRKQIRTRPERRLLHGHVREGS